MIALPKSRRRLPITRVCAGLLVVLLVAGCGSTQAQATKPSEVVITSPITDEVTDYQEFTGRLDAFRTVEVRARVSGYVTDVPFKEGEEVHVGDTLFQIDTRTYQADLNQAIANLNTAIADQRLQEKNVERARQLMNRGATLMSAEEYDQIVAALDKAKATVGAMQAAKERAQLYLDYTKVIASCDGRISRRFVDPGNLVKADDTMLTTIVTEDPMFAYFDVDERTYLDLQKLVSPGDGAWASDGQVAVQMRLANEDRFTRTGTINFIDNRVTANTGTIRMRGVFRNPQRLLKPGLFVRIRLPIRPPYKAVLIPDEALLSDQGRKYVLVVSDKGEVVYRAVKVGQAIHELRVIHDGLREGDKVIVSGMQRVRPGSKVVAKAQDPPKKPSAVKDQLSAAEGGPTAPPTTDKDAPKDSPTLTK